MKNQDTVNVDQFQYGFVRYNDNKDGKSLLIFLTNQIDVKISVAAVDVSNAFSAGDKICDLITATPVDCLTVSPDGKVDLSIEINGLPKVYGKSQ